MIEYLISETDVGLDDPTDGSDDDEDEDFNKFKSTPETSDTNSIITFFNIPSNSNISANAAVNPFQI